MLGGPHIMQGLQGWAFTYRVCNMHLERLLSQIKKAMGRNKSPEAERLASGGFLCQLLREHLDRGGRDPRYQDRKSLFAVGAPLVAAQKEKGQTRPGSGFIAFKKAKQASRLAARILEEISHHRSFDPRSIRKHMFDRPSSCDSGDPSMLRPF